MSDQTLDIDRSPTRTLVWPYVVARIAHHVRASPGRSAVEDAGASVTYAQLWRRAVAASLRAEGIRRGNLVAVAADRGAEFIAGALGTWLAGAAYRHSTR